MLHCNHRAVVAAALVLNTLVLTRLVFAAGYEIAQAIDVDTVPSSFRVGFCLLTDEQRQYVGYYNAEHQMVVASRKLDSSTWQKRGLPTKVGWDSHNYITMAVDSEGQLHVAGNMHCVPLIYFRTREQGDIATLEKLPMTGQHELRCTYPRFLDDVDGNLLFMYRSGSSGNGRRFFNRYDVANKTWHRFLDTPLFDGEDLRNAYPLGPTKGPDGLFHIVWVWRDTPDCATNHDLSYARSPDLKHWETVDGKPLQLPITLEQTEAVVDPVPSGGGIINSGLALTFDSNSRPIVSYHKRDKNNHMQIYVARPEDGVWEPRAITQWDKEVPFSGRGSMGFIGIDASPLELVAPDTFLLSYRHRNFGIGQIVLDARRLEPVDRNYTPTTVYPADINRKTIAFEGIDVRTASDLGQSSESNVRYLLKWETLGPNHDRPHAPPLPPPSNLQLIELRQ